MRYHSAVLGLLFCSTILSLTGCGMVDGGRGPKADNGIQRVTESLNPYAHVKYLEIRLSENSDRLQMELVRQIVNEETDVLSVHESLMCRGVARQNGEQAYEDFLYNMQVGYLFGWRMPDSGWEAMLDSFLSQAGEWDSEWKWHLVSQWAGMLAAVGSQENLAKLLSLIEIKIARDKMPAKFYFSMVRPITASFPLETKGRILPLLRDGLARSLGESSAAEIMKARFEERVGSSW